MSDSSPSLNILCISRFFKGEKFISSCRKQGHNVYLLTSSHLRDNNWPYHDLSDAFYMDEDEHGEWNMDFVINGLAYRMRSLKFDLFIALDDFDVENVAYLRETFRIPGMGETTARYFRDKLAMRLKAQEHGISVPAFSSLFHDEDINHYADSVPGPWVVKPRHQASAAGIKKVHTKDELWRVVHERGDERHDFLVEKFAPGDVYHVDSLILGGKVVFAKASKYNDTPLDVAHSGGVFRSATLDDKHPTAKALLKENEKIMKAFGMRNSASHTEFIIGHEDGTIYFLETSARVGGANIAEMVEAATGLNLWTEWAKLEIAAKQGLDYELPKLEKKHAGILVSLSRYEYPDMSKFTDSEIVWRMKKKNHIGLIVKSDSPERIQELLAKYTKMVQDEFHASMPAPDRPVA